jgi:Holliday junction resolvase-like predicted endonuclease
MELPKPNPQQVAQAGEHLVAAELHRRGAYAVTFAGNMPEIDILASDRAQTKTVAIQVKAKRTGTWHAKLREWTKRSNQVAAARFWVFVDLHVDPESRPDFYIVRERWIQADIDRAHAAYLARHGGVRPRTTGSTHHAITRARIAKWKDRWDLLGIF